MIQYFFPEVKKSNNVNDYVKYGKKFAEANFCVPSIALEPSIYPYHTIGEKVFISDINKILEIITKFVALNVDKS